MEPLSVLLPTVDVCQGLAIVVVDQLGGDMQVADMHAQARTLGRTADDGTDAGLAVGTVM
jgi:hypothetical protein